MKRYNGILRTGMAALTALALVSALAYAAIDENGPNKAVFTRPLTWRADTLGMYNFAGTGLVNAVVGEDGSVMSAAAGGTCELLNSYETKGAVRMLAANWSFTGKVKLEVSVTGDSKDYVKVTNGVPVYFDENASGNKIRWRAALEPNSALGTLSISYSDNSGVAGAFGTELLSGFASRREFYIKGSAAGSLYNHQVQIVIGESEGSSDDCDIKLTGGILSDFADVRFAQADGETVLPHYLEKTSGAAPNRLAQFWVKIPEIPEIGIPLYIYFGKAAARDISSADKVFDLFDDFNGDALDSKKWKVTLEAETGSAIVSDSYLVLNMAKAVTAVYKFPSGILEYEAAVSPGGAAVGIVRQASGSAEELSAYSSQTEATAHCIAKGSSVAVNDPKPIAPDVIYRYAVYADDTGKLEFKRFVSGEAQDPEAGVKYDSGPGEASAIGLYPSNQAKEAKFGWIRTRRYADPEPQVDPERTALSGTEAVDLPTFDNIERAEDGSLAVVRNGAKGYYTSSLIGAKFEARMIRPSWTVESSDARDVLVAVTTDDSSYSSGWANGIARYVSKKEFEKGSKLRFRAELTAETPDEGEETVTHKISLKNIGLEYQPGTIRVVLPNGGETIKSGSQYNIFWEMTGYDKDYPVEISYIKSGSEVYETIASKTDNSGDYVWSVPNEEIAGALVKAADYHDKSIYGLSEAYFVVSSKVDEMAESSTEYPEGEPIAGSLTEDGSEDNTPMGKYELLVKVGDNPLAHGYKDGDIVMIKPAGYLWGAEEKSKFLILQADLTEREVRELLKPKEQVGGKPALRRKHKVNMLKYNLKERLSKIGSIFKGKPAGKPMLAIEDVEEKK